MSGKPTRLVGLSLADFNSLLKSGKEIHVQPARLIPFYKPGDEMALTSIFLAGLRLIKEFRKNILKSIGVSSGGTMYIYTEVEFAFFDKKRLDGLILMVRSKRIVHAVAIEVKNKNNTLDGRQIFDYSTICRAYGIPKLLTISNQFVNFPTQSPTPVKPVRGVSLFHFSWSYILTIAYILLTDNDNNIADEDQIELMKEIVKYLESPKSGVLGFNRMKAGWTEVVQKTNAGVSLKLRDESVDETVSSWLQEERDMALILSRELRLLVQSGEKKYKTDLMARIKNAKRQLVSNKNLVSHLRVDGAVSDIVVIPHFGRKNIEMSVTLKAPQDRKVRPQITWIRNQLRACRRKNPDLFSRLENDLMVDINAKYTRAPVRVPFTEIEDARTKLAGKEIKSFNISLVNYLGRKFESRKLFVTSVEKMLLEYYQGIVQYLKNWEKPAPRIQPAEEKSDHIE